MVEQLIFYRLNEKEATFDHDEMTFVLDGSPKITMKKRWIYESNTKDELDVEELGDSRKYDLERERAIGIGLSNFMRIHKKHFDRLYVPQQYEIPLMQNASLSGGYPGYGLFLTTVMGQCDDEQTRWWLYRTLTCQMTGAYAQTELGHGSNVRGLETTATYDGDCFILHSPTLRSIKFWPSSMVSATHAAVYAQLWIKGKCYGVHVFMLQLRDENFKPLPGIEIGDVGTKLGELSVDIGYLRMNQVRIPLRCLMAKRQIVTADGEYKRLGGGGGKGGKNKLAYLTMMGARVTLASGASGALSKACTIATRYCAVRRQGFKSTSEKEEMTLLDYGFTQYRLLKQLAFAVANKFSCNHLNEILGDFRIKLAGNNASDETEAIANLSELHATSAGLKGLCCERTALGIEDCRKSCGGAAYLLSSGIAALETDFKWRATAEGDTVIMLLETAKFLMKSVKRSREGEILNGLAMCLNEIGRGVDESGITENFVCPSDVNGWLDLNFLEDLFKRRTMASVLSAERLYSSLLLDGKDEREAFAECTLPMMRCAEAHVLYFILSTFKSTIEKKASDKPAVRRVLTLLAQVFALSEVLDGSNWSSLLSGQDEILAQRAVMIACRNLRPDAVALVDCFEYPDSVLNSTIGRKDGNVYEAQYEATVKSPLNRKLIPTWMKEIKPFLDLEYLSLRNGEEGAANWSGAAYHHQSKM